MQKVLVALAILLLCLSLAACASPEAVRQRSGGLGADVGNRPPTVESFPSKFVAVTPAPFLSPIGATGSVASAAAPDKR
ncbi:MAG: hypothetical protein U0822_06840 [Anaerolineae bacterium]